MALWTPVVRSTSSCGHGLATCAILLHWRRADWNPIHHLRPRRVPQRVKDLGGIGVSHFVVHQDGLGHDIRCVPHLWLSAAPYMAIGWAIATGFWSLSLGCHCLALLLQEARWHLRLRAGVQPEGAESGFPFAVLMMCVVWATCWLTCPPTRSRSRREARAEGGRTQRSHFSCARRVASPPSFSSVWDEWQRVQRHV